MSSKHTIGGRFSKISIRLCYKVIAVLVIVFIANLARTSVDALNSMNEENRKKALSVINTANIAVEKRYDFGSGSYLQELCDQLKSVDSDILEVSISTVKKDIGMKVIASTDKNRLDDINENQYYTVLRNNSSMFLGNNSFFNDAKKLQVLSPLNSNNKPVAVISVTMDLESRDAAIKSYILKSLTRTLLTLLLTVLLIYLLLRIEVFKPLRQLTTDAREIARGNFKRRSLVENNNDNEIGELAREFNILAMYLQQREEENERLLKSVKEKWVKAEAKSQIDSLTKLENHRSFQDKLGIELDRALRNEKPLTLLFCDLDKFKSFNDTNGHQLGDKALYEVARIIKQSIRLYDIAARYGGEEFTIILPNTDVDEAMNIAERIRKKVETHSFSIDGGLGNMTISIGIAALPDDSGDKELLIAAADYAMYESKKHKGNYVSIFTSFGKHDSKQVS